MSIRSLGLFLTAGMILLAAAGARGETLELKPMGAMVKEVGSEQMVGYFMPGGGNCDVTMMVGESPTSDDTGATAGTARVRFMLVPEASATIEAETGQMVRMTCGADARTMMVEDRPTARQLASR